MVRYYLCNTLVNMRTFSAIKGFVRHIQDSYQCSVVLIWFPPDFLPQSTDSFFFLRKELLQLSVTLSLGSFFFKRHGLRFMAQDVVASVSAERNQIKCFSPSIQRLGTPLRGSRGSLITEKVFLSSYTVFASNVLIYLWWHNAKYVWKQDNAFFLFI